MSRNRSGCSLLHRPRRNRQNEAIRELVSEMILDSRSWVAPLFVQEQSGREAIVSMPHCYRLGVEALVEEATVLFEKGVWAVALFPVLPPELKSETGREAFNPNGLMPRVIKRMKRELPELLIIADVALDPYTSHGHDGLLNLSSEVDNDLTVVALTKQALLLAAAGADILAPSDMMDGRIGVLRTSLDEAGWHNLPLLAYTAKYASSLYAPFREVLTQGESVNGVDKRSYQLDPRNRREAVREALLDEKEGADMLMVKPALPYLDVIQEVKAATSLPVGAYQVSGEYAMVMAAHQKGFLDAKDSLYELLTAIRRSGADFIFTYAIPFLLEHH